MEVLYSGESYLLDYSIISGPFYKSDSSHGCDGVPNGGAVSNPSRVVQYPTNLPTKLGLNESTEAAHWNKLETGVEQGIL